ncbi:hypothetical protein PybrP1_001278 [[Pythium] brassicae (nom. inval.)]|nr:hypothetical protein PybrP1_001278 [[Pythium] brassicae (nom. inval.)]
MFLNWCCKKQSRVATSTAHAEFVASAVCGQPAFSVGKLLIEIGLTVETPVLLLIDINAAMLQMKNEVSYTSRTQAGVKLKFLRDYASKSSVKTEQVGPLIIVSNLLTKELPAARVISYTTYSDSHEHDRAYSCSPGCREEEFEWRTFSDAPLYADLLKQTQVVAGALLVQRATFHSTERTHALRDCQ